ADTPIGRHEVERFLRPQVARDTYGPAEVGQVRAAAHADVLAGVDELTAGGVVERTGPAAEPAARLADGNGEAALRQAHRRRQPSARPSNMSRSSLTRTRSSPAPTS